jgi:hypothetical protein
LSTSKAQERPGTEINYSLQGRDLRGPWTPAFAGVADNVVVRWLQIAKLET